MIERWFAMPELTILWILVKFYDFLCRCLDDKVAELQIGSQWTQLIWRSERNFVTVNA